MTTDFRALCAELLAWAEKTSSHYYKQADVLLRARAALSESVPSAKRERSRINIDEMCEILRSLEIKPTEYTDCAVLYEVSLDQLRVICDTRAALAEQPVGEGSSRRRRVDIKAILADPVLKKEIVEGATDFICKVEGIRPHSLSPAAQAVMDAYSTEADRLDREVSDNEMLAAALRAVADQSENFYVPHVGDVSVVCVEKLLAIATELETHQ